nr:protein kinase-like domain-containing protein [Tanacetum cinerariifolium]
MFHGVIPTNLSGCSELKELGLAFNKLVGSIPKEIGFLIESNNFTGDNPFGGRIPDTLGRWKSLTEIDASSCELYGIIPHFIYNLSQLSYLSLPFNHLTASLHPTTGSMLPNLLYLQLMQNQLTGIIPPSLSNCSKLQLIELMDNKFTGKLTIDFSKLKDITEKSKEQMSQLSRKEQFLKVSYNQLLKATDGFSEANLIGLGGFSSVYKGILNDEEFVAVKVLRLQSQRAYKSFLAECEAMDIFYKARKFRIRRPKPEP